VLSDSQHVGGGHADRPVALEYDNEGRTVVVKQHPHDVAGGIFDGMCALWSSPFGRNRSVPGMPQPLSLRTAEGAIVMNFIEGPALGSRGDLGTTVDHLDAAARLLAGLHRSGVVVSRVRTGGALLRSITRKRDELAPSPLRDKFDFAITLASARPQVDAQQTLVVSHGDFSPRNIIVSTDGLRLIDFDRLQMAVPSRDVEYFGAWTWVTDLMAATGEGWAIADAFGAAYCRHAPGSAAQIATDRSFYRAMALLRIAHGWTALHGLPGTAGRVADEAIRHLT
jgi:aminoglycoside phosphotransferase (APT) family kinase protein